jgi:hypothetical protein
VMMIIYAMRRIRYCSFMELASQVGCRHALEKAYQKAEDVYIG